MARKTKPSFLRGAVGIGRSPSRRDYEKEWDSHFHGKACTTRPAGWQGNFST
jgi:hypothetical protein